MTWVWLPYPDAVDRMGGVPDGIDVDVYDGSGDLPSSADEVQLWVPPYVGAGLVVRRVDPPSAATARPSATHGRRR